MYTITLCTSDAVTPDSLNWLTANSQESEDCVAEVCAVP